jgi:hypothetical protein
MSLEVLKRKQSKAKQSKAKQSKAKQIPANLNWSAGIVLLKELTYRSPNNYPDVISMNHNIKC